jgi:acyl carrier protein
VTGRRSVKRIVRRFVEDELLDGRRPNGDPLREGMLDSLGAEHLILFLEERFGVSLEDDDMVQERFDSLDGVANLVTAKLRTEGRA